MGLGQQDWSPQGKFTPVLGVQPLGSLRGVLQSKWSLASASSWASRPELGQREGQCLQSGGKPANPCVEEPLVSRLIIGM